MSIGAWQPLWIGEPERHIYAALHRPAQGDAALGVLLVPPLLHEQPRSRRFITEVASACAANGVAALRFDFYGSGDSAGSAADTRLTSMHEDLRRGCQTLRSHAGVTRIAIIAWRVGALVAWDWLRQNNDAATLVMWEPICDGRAWLAQTEAGDTFERCSPDRYTGVRASSADTSDGQLMGYAVSHGLRTEMAGLLIDIAAGLPEVSVRILERSDASAQGDTRSEPVHAIVLPDEAPRFGGSTRMDESLFMSPSMERWVTALVATLAGDQ